MDKYTIISLIAPLIAPLAPATVLINTFYLAMIEKGIDKNIALFTSTASGIGAELSGMVAAYAAVQAYRKGKTGHFWMAILAFAIYIILVAFGIATGHNSAALVFAMCISIAAYLGGSTLQDLTQEKAEHDTVSTLDIEKQKLNIAQTKANAEIERAKARQIEAGGIVQSDASTGRPVDSEQLDEGKLEIARAYMMEHPDASTRDVAKAIGAASPTTGMKYRNAVLAEKENN